MRIRILPATLFVSLLTGGPLPVQGEEPSGLWLMPRHDCRNTGRASVAAHMTTAPQEIWRYGGEAGVYSFVKKLGDGDFLVQVGRGLGRVNPDGKARWSRPTLGVGAVIEIGDFNGDGRDDVLVALGQKGLGLLDLADGKTLWEWTAPPGSHLLRHQILWRPGGARLFVFPRFSMRGFCFDFAGTHGTPKLVWQHDYTGKYLEGFGPSFVLADMDNDGTPEIVAASKGTIEKRRAYLAVIDSETGDVRFDLSFAVEGGPDMAGRPYGLLQAVDVDGDGYRDVVLMMSQVEEYIAVVRNEGGKALRPVWSRFFEKDFPTDFMEFHPDTTSVVDVNGDGKPELVFGLYNATGDKRWHTLALDPMTGLDQPRKDFVDRYYWGTADLDGDGVPEIILSPTRSRYVSEVTTLEAVNGRTLRAVSTIEDARLVTSNMGITRTRLLPNDRVFYTVLVSPVAERGGLVVRRRGKESVWRIAGGKSVFAPRPAAEAPKHGRAIAASAPLVGFANGKRELVMSLSDGTIIGGVPDWKRPDRFKSSWRVRGTMPALWLGPDLVGDEVTSLKSHANQRLLTSSPTGFGKEGERVLCAIDRETETLLLHRPGTTRRPVEIPLPLPVNRNGTFADKTANLSDAYPRASLWPMPFGTDTLRVLVGLRPGEHVLASALCDGNGKILWLDRDHGPYPRAAAMADIDGDGADELVVDDHGMQYFYKLDGTSRLVAHVWGDTIKGRDNGCAYALPIVGPYGPDGKLRIVMSPGLTSLETMDGAGNRVARRAMTNHFEFGNRVAAVGNPRGGKRWDMGVVSELGVFHCIDTETLEPRWKLPLGEPTLWPIAVTAADLTGDGRDDFLVGLPSGDLVAVTEKNGRGEILWRKTFSAGVIETIFADFDGDGEGEVIVQTDDGFVRVLAGESGTRRR